MELIDKEQAYQVLSDYYHHAVPSQHKALREALDRVPVVDAIPVHIIQDRIDQLQTVADYALESNGGYIESANSSLYELKLLLSMWKKEQEEQNGV